MPKIMQEEFLPKIPEFITVHLGRPEQSAPNVTVTFPEYIKNVASGEIYPTWNESAIRANIYAQISFALNRVYLEFYRSQGYDFDITSSTSIDQSYSQGRNIFENISYIVDDIFDSYIRRRGTIEPLASSFCNGTTVTCAGLSQWGSEDLAQQGFLPYEILTYYYGDDIDIITDVPIQNIEESYPGTPLRPGDTSPDVYTIQFELNAISNNYPLIPKIYPVNYVFDENTENAVKTFQQIFDLTPDGIVGRRTWYKLVYLYTGILKLSELNSLGVDLNPESYISVAEAKEPLDIGAKGEEVLFITYMLSVISTLYINIPETDVTDTYTQNTKASVSALQLFYNLPVTGTVDRITYDTVYSAYITSAGYLDLQGYSFEDFSNIYEKDLKDIQRNLNFIAKRRKDILPVTETGLLGPKTIDGILKIKKNHNLTQNRLLDKKTILKIEEESLIYQNSVNPSKTQYPGYPLSIGMTDKELIAQNKTTSTPIKNLQVMLREISFFYPNVTRVIPTHAFGESTFGAVITFQQEASLPQNGIVDFSVWQEIVKFYNNALSSREEPLPFK